MAISNSTIFTRAAQESPAAPAKYISILRKKLLKNLEINGEARINTWVDSMKASSPTHIKVTPSLADHDQSSWIVSI
jgi:trehalose 6-phosphate phosphatase